MVKVALRSVFSPFIWVAWKLLRSPRIQAIVVFVYDYRRYVRCVGAMWQSTEEACLAQIIMSYHVIEKGLTMPNRRFSFGHDAMRHLMTQIDRYASAHSAIHPQVVHAIGVVRAYDEMHRTGFERTDDVAYWKTIEDFLSRYPNVSAHTQRHMTREEFFANQNSPFPEFSESRHTLRHYEGVVDLDAIRKAVRLAQSAPSACNRQHIRVYCVADHALRDQILALQNGNRGFGHLADKLLILTGDLEDIRWVSERHDVYTNGGIFLMNLCYALHYHRIAHCILNCSFFIDGDRRVRKMLGVKDSEVFIAMLCCGQAPASFDVALSPRRDMSEIYREL